MSLKHKGHDNDFSNVNMKQSWIVYNSKRKVLILKLWKDVFQMKVFWLVVFWEMFKSKAWGERGKAMIHEVCQFP